MLSKLKILLVDDSKEDRFLLRHAFADSGLDCELEEAVDGEEAELFLLRKKGDGELPDFVILDLFLPKRSGVEVMETLCAHGLTESLRVIVLSSVLPEAKVQSLQKLGAWRVMEKPIALDDFLALGKCLRDLSLEHHQLRPASQTRR